MSFRPTGDCRRDAGTRAAVGRGLELVAASGRRRGGKLGLVLLLAALAALPPPDARAGEPSSCAAGDDRCIAAAARALMEQGEHAAAVELLKAALPHATTPRELALLLASAYHAEGNAFWAQRSLAPLLADNVGDCEARLWLAWMQMQQGSLEASSEHLGAARCPQGPLAARRALVEAMLARQAGDTEAGRAALRRARGADQAFSADRDAIARLSASWDESYLPPLRLRLEVGAGWSSNTLAGSPSDPGTSGGVPGPLGQLGLGVELTAPGDWRARPRAEAETRGLGLGSKDSRELSYLLVGVRPGLAVTLGSVVLTAGYRYEAVLLAGGDPRHEAAGSDPEEDGAGDGPDTTGDRRQGPYWFHAAHRGEVEAQLPHDITLFAGAGKRTSHQRSRTRLEVDGGAGGALRLHDRWRLLGALSGRRHDAVALSSYDLRGGTLLLSLDHSLPAAFRARAGIMTALDDYPRWRLTTQSRRRRRDLLGRVSASLFSPRLTDVRLGLTYELSRRSSNVDAYDYTDHRVLLKLTWSAIADLWLPREVRSAQAGIPYALVGEEEEEERIQDLLRQDEAAERGSSCVD